MTDIPQKHVTVTSLPIVRLEHLWVLFSLSIIGVFISMVPTSPNDFWWHLKAGELIATSGIPTTNRFAWTLPADTPYIYQSWLGEWLFYLLYQLGGLPFIVFARNLLGMSAFALVAYETRQRSGSWRLAAGATFLAAAMSMNNFTTRTQNWSWVPFVAILILLGRYVDRRIGARWLIALPLLMVFWVNVHGGFMMGIIVTGAFVTGETLRRLMRQPRALNWQQLRALYMTLGAMIAATIVNPLGIGVFDYVLLLLSDPPSQQLINEWRPPTPHNIAGVFFYVGILIVIATFAFARRRPSITDVILVCGLAWQAFNGVRYVIWFGMVAMPIAAQCLAKPRAIFTMQEEVATPRISIRERGGGTFANMVLAVGMVVTVVVFQPWLKPILPLPEPYQALFAPVPGAPQLFTVDTPVAATEHLRMEPCSGNLFNEMGYGSYLSWALYPQAQTFIDPRVELYPLGLWLDYVNLTEGRDVLTLLERYDITCVMLDRGHQPQLAEAMPILSGWDRTFANDHSEIWRRAQ